MSDLEGGKRFCVGDRSRQSMCEMSEVECALKASPMCFVGHKWSLLHFFDQMI